MKKICALLLFFSCFAYGKLNDKTLVSWVTLEDKSVQGGSLITLWGGDFDGIFYGKKAAGRWMAGSAQFKRTEKDQEKNAVEDSDEMIQMAIVYKGKQITIYRNGEIYSSYEFEGDPKVFNNVNIVTIGKEHAKDMGGIGAIIEDTRVYDQPLTQEEIQALKPNVKSAIEPYLWWDFENGPEELTGKLPHQLLNNEAFVKDGKLYLSRGDSLVAAKVEHDAYFRSPKSFMREPYKPDLPVWPENPPENWPKYHLVHPTPKNYFPFDPNTAIYHKGRYHLHYIYRNKYGFVFAHVSSTDMIHWEWHPTVLAPPNNGHGMFSGTGFLTKEGKVAHTYFGEGSNRNWIQYALDDNLDSWSKPEVILPKDKNGKPLKNAEYFDPDIWIMDGQYYALNGRSSKKSPVIMKSDDLKNWLEYGELLHPDFDEEKLGVSRDEDISCPNIFKLGDKWVLLCISHGLGCRYFIGDFVDGYFLPEHHAVMGGHGRSYFAPESLLTPDGRRVYWAWNIDARPQEAGGLQSLPTEMKLAEDGTMMFLPIKELEKLRYDEQKFENVAAKKQQTQVIKGLQGKHMELIYEVKNTADKDNFGITVVCDEKGENGVKIRVDRKNNNLYVGHVRADFELKKDEPLKLRIFVDATFIEVYANNRQVVARSVGPRDRKKAVNSHVALFSNEGDMEVDSITTWQMKGTFEK